MACQSRDARNSRSLADPSSDVLTGGEPGLFQMDRRHSTHSPIGPPMVAGRGGMCLANCVASTACRAGYRCLELFGQPLGDENSMGAMARLT